MSCDDPRRSHTHITAPLYADSTGWDAVSRMQHVYLLTWLRGDILVKVDKVTMANSLELRLPFLDPEVFGVVVDLRTSRTTVGIDDEAGSPRSFGRTA